VIAVLTDQNDFQGARNYWKVLKHRLLKEGNDKDIFSLTLQVLPL